MIHARQVHIPGWDQEQFRAAKVLVVGTGALGSSLAHSLAHLGVGHILLVDPDRVEEHNLENQCFTEADIGKPKAVALKERLVAIDPSLIVEVFVARIQEVYDPLDFTAIFGCLDNVAARQWLNFVAVRDGKTLIDGGITGFRGQVKTIIPGRTACQMCVPTLPTSTAKASCASNPVPSTFLTANVIANLQAAQFVKLVQGKPIDSYLQVDLERSALHRANLAPSAACELCGPTWLVAAPIAEVADG